MKLRRIKRIVWFACSEFMKQVRIRVDIHEKLGELYSKRQRKFLIHGNAKSAFLMSEKASHHDRKAEHYRKFLRTH